jgi:Tfp pilus assembly protein PilF
LGPGRRRPRLHKQNRLTEARQEIDRAITSTPHFFDAADLKATICMAQGEHAEAQKVLDEVAKKTPRNYLRKRCWPRPQR